MGRWNVSGPFVARRFSRHFLRLSQANREWMSRGYPAKRECFFLPRAVSVFYTLFYSVSPCETNRWTHICYRYTPTKTFRRFRWQRGSLRSLKFHTMQVLMGAVMDVLEAGCTDLWERLRSSPFPWHDTPLSTSPAIAFLWQEMLMWSRHGDTCGSRYPRENNKWICNLLLEIFLSFVCHE